MSIYIYRNKGIYRDTKDVQGLRGYIGTFKCAYIYIYT